MHTVSHTINLINLSDTSTINSMVEHRRVFNLPHCELNIFETFRRCEDVVLSYNGLVVSSMMRGKKIMQLQEKEFEFLPGETVILPEGVSMKVGFPEADEKHPVQCATLALDWNMVQKNLDFLNEHYPYTEAPYTWQLNFQNYHFVNNKELAGSINRLISISMEDSPVKEGLADLALKSLMLRLVQTQNLANVTQHNGGDERLTGAVHYIKQNLTQKILLPQLAKLAYMSKTAFAVSFKNNYGIAPLEYILQQRISHAKQLLTTPVVTVTEACYASGFQNVNYFIRQFKKREGLTPKQYKSSLGYK